MESSVKVYTKVVEGQAPQWSPEKMTGATHEAMIVNVRPVRIVDTKDLLINDFHKALSEPAAMTQDQYSDLMARCERFMNRKKEAQPVKEKEQKVEGNYHAH